MDDKEYIIDREYTPFIFNAIIGIKSSEWSQLYSVENFHIYFNKTVHSADGLKYYTITFFSDKISSDNWMEVGHGGTDVKEVNVDLDIVTKKIIRIYGGR